MFNYYYYYNNIDIVMSMIQAVVSNSVEYEILKALKKNLYTGFSPQHYQY